MEDTTDKSSAPEVSTEEAAPSEPLNDKDLGQADIDTGASTDGNQAPEGAVDGSERTEDSEQEPANPEEGSEEAEGQILTPEEVKNLPPELKATHASMQSAFAKKMAKANELIEQAEGVLSKKGNDAPPAGDEPSPARMAVENALKRRGVDLKTLSSEHLASLELVAEVAMEGGLTKANEVVAPLEQREAKAQVDGYFEKHPDRSKYRKQMGALDHQTGGKLNLDTLFYAVAGKDLAASAEGRKQEKLRDLAKGNSESGNTTTGKSSGEGDIFDEIANAGGHENTVLR